jgi:hypothetical protein
LAEVPGAIPSDNPTVTAAPASAEITPSAAWRRGLIQLAPSLPLFATLALASVFLLATTPGFIVQDTWIALVAGREIVQHGLPTHEQLTILAAGRRWVDQQWLGQLVIYGLSLAGGIKLVVLTCEAAALSAWGFAIAAAGRRGPVAPGVVTVLVALGILSSPWGLQVRTQELALPLYAAVLWLLLTDPRLVRRRTLSVLGLLVVWANVHGSVVLGVAVVVAYAVTAWRAAAPRRRLLPYVATPLTLLASPYATRLPGYYHLMIVSPPFRRYIQEWQPSRPSITTAIFYLLAAVTLAVVIRRRHAYQPGEIVILVLACASAAWAIRNIVWFALAAAAILPARERGEAFRTASAGVAAIAMACVIPVSAALALAKPATYWQGHVSNQAAIALAPLVHGKSTVFADDSHADWLLWRFPELRGRLVYDDRVELLTSGQLRMLQRALYGRGGTLGACLVVVDPGLAKHFSGRVAWRDRTTAVIEERSQGCPSGRGSA